MPVACVVFEGRLKVTWDEWVRLEGIPVASETIEGCSCTPSIPVPVAVLAAESRVPLVGRPSCCQLSIVVFHAVVHRAISQRVHHEEVALVLQPWHFQPLGYLEIIHVRLLAYGFSHVCVCIFVGNGISVRCHLVITAGHECQAEGQQPPCFFYHRFGDLGKMIFIVLFAKVEIKRRFCKQVGMKL